MRCDLHVHSTASGMCNTPGLTRVCRESYNDPEEVYDRLKRRGMSIVTMTDHDSIDATEILRRHADFFLSEEATVQMPSGTLMHLGVYGITERDHAEIQCRRNDFIALLMYLTERKLFFSVNHVFSGLTGRRDEDDFSWFASYVPAFEIRNGQMWPEANVRAERLAKRLGKIGVAGSDAHTIAGVGLTYTEVPGVRTVDEFLSGLRAGRGIIHGVHGSYAKLTADVYRIAKAFFWEKPWALPILPLTVLVPAITAGHWLNEIPCQFEPHCWSKVLPPDKFSFPSGHTMTAFSIALVVSYFYPSLEGPLFFLALSIAVSRIVLGMHFLSDVLAGAVLGVALGCASITAFASFGLA